MDICGKLAAGAPTGMKEYIEFNLAAFKAADKAVTLVEKHTDDILNALIDIDKLFNVSTSNKNSVFNHGGVFDDIHAHPNDPSNQYFGK